MNEYPIHRDVWAGQQFVRDALTDYQGQPEPPSVLDDSIGYHLWHEANKCPDCRGTGEWRPRSCKELYEMPSPADGKCYGCQGRGVRPELFDPEF